MSLLLEPKDLQSSYSQLCQQLNLDEYGKEKAWSLYTEVQIRERLPPMADPLHWLVCALYLVCSQSRVESVSGGEFQGAGVSLVQMLRQSQLSLTKFFSLIKIWVQRVHATPEDSQRLKLLEMKFLIVQEAFRKYKQYFLQLFKSPDMNIRPLFPGIKQQRARMKFPCTPSEMFNFGWSLFLLTKSQYPSIADNLVYSHYLLLNVLDFLYSNVLNSDRIDMLNENFPVFSESKTDELKFHHKISCIIPYLVSNDLSIVRGCEDLSSHYWNPFLTQLFETEVLVDKKSFTSPSEFSGKLKVGLLDSSVFAKNSQSIVNAYELYVLQENQLDERIFLRDNSSSEIGMFKQQMEDLTIQENSPETHNGVPASKLKPPVTPLTSKSLLMPKTVDTTPFSASNVEAKWLTDFETSNGPKPSHKLCGIFNRLDSTLLEIIGIDIKKFLDVFSKQFYQDDNCYLPIDQVITKFVSLSQTLCYIFLEHLVLVEINSALSKESGDHIFKIVTKDIFIRSLVALCVEIVLFAHSSQKTFPWITEVLELTGYDFSQLIQPILEYTKFLSRATVKHLSRIEERILEELIWKRDSQLWEVLEMSDQPIPAWEEVMPSEQRRLIEKGVVTLPQKPLAPGTTPLSPHPISRCFNSPAPRPLPPRIYSPLKPKPIRPNRFGTDTTEATLLTSHFPRSLFTPKKDSVFKRVQITPIKTECLGSESSEISDVSLRMSAMTSFIPKTLSTNCVPPPVRREVGLQTFSTLNPVDTQVYSTSGGNLKAQRKGSIAIIFKKIYYLVHTRLRDLCNKLGYQIKIVQVIWTTFETCMRENTTLFKDRHLDQILLCCIYIMSRVLKLPLKFEDMTAKYRTQPQANSLIYNSVLLNNHQAEQDVINIPFGMRGDIVQFYNKVYLKEMESCAKILGQDALNPSCSPTLSPLPFHLTMSLPRYSRIDTCSQPIYVRTHEFIGARRENSPRKVITNPLFTPGKEMRAINQSIHERGLCKRRIDMRGEISNDDINAILSPAKRPTAPYPMQRENIVKLLQSEMQGDSDGDMEL